METESSIGQLLVPIRVSHPILARTHPSLSATERASACPRGMTGAGFLHSLPADLTLSARLSAAGDYGPIEVHETPTSLGLLV